jgi:predicted patatin/cPLA2 family phospholipase
VSGAAEAGPPLPETLRFEQLVLSGGGTRCFWHGGFAGVVVLAIRLASKPIAAVSGGALSACAFVGRVERRLF